MHEVNRFDCGREVAPLPRVKGSEGVQITKLSDQIQSDDSDVASVKDY